MCDPVEHDGGNHLMNTTTQLQKRDRKTPDHPGNHRREQGYDQIKWRRQVHQTHRDRGQGANV